MRLGRAFFRDIIANLASAGQGLLDRRAGADTEEEIRALCRALLRSKGEASVVTLARRTLDSFARLDDGGREEFFEFLLGELGAEPPALDAALDAYRSSPEPGTAAALAAAAEPRRQELLRLMNTAPDGTRDILSMRAALLGALAGRPELRPVDDDFVHILRSWFNRGFLELHRIDWRTPALVLEKIIEYEAVHQVLDWEDLRRRLQADRRCFGFFHPALPDEPLIFVEVALCKGLAGSVTELLFGEVDPDVDADTAIFYSISNCQRGLTGISFGNFLIKQVVHELAVEIPGLRRFATLSPIPGFRKWLMREASDGRLVNGRNGREATFEGIETADWPADTAPGEHLKDALMRHCARYLLEAKRGIYPLDPVARFHLRNGARLERINWMGDPSPAGISQSAGMMVNYVYDEGTVVANHEAFVNEGRIAHSRAVAALAGAAAD
ncbi:MAG: malonyl-CoA decarboxylase [Immundisolibacterales bacterium]|nr:malonyl-CoA decarboxylase [Immundisolibacterales bacterium]